MMKIILNSIVWTTNVELMKIYVNYLQLNTPMARSKYMRLKLRDFPESMMQQYNFEANSTKDSYMYVEIKRGLYGLL